MPGDLPVKIDAGDIFYRIDVVHLQIHDAAALPADKMIMRGGIAVKMLRAVAHVQFPYFPDFAQKLEIPVDRAEADVGKGFSDIHIYRVRRRMIRARHQKIFNDFPLSAVFQRHADSPCH